MTQDRSGTPERPTAEASTPPAPDGRPPVSPDAAAADAAQPVPPGEPATAETTAGPSPWDTPPEEPPGGTAVRPDRRLHRSRSDRVVAGVAGGLGEYTGVDPRLFRVLLVVLSFFGGVGVLLYLVGWLFLATDGDGVSPAETLRFGGTGRSPGEGAVLVLAVLAAGAAVIRGDVGDVTLLVLAAAGALLLVRRSRHHPGDVRPPEPVETSDPHYGAGPGWPPHGPPMWTTEGTGPAGVGTVTLPAPTSPWPPAQRRRPPRQRSTLGPATLSAAVLVLGVLGILDATGVLDPGRRLYLAVALAVVGLGLVVGGWVGRARWLALLGVPMTVALVVSGWAGSAYPGGTGTRRYSPATVADVQQRYDLGAGDVELDLTAVPFVDRNVDTRVSVGAGDVRIVLPRNVDVVFDGRVDAGQLAAFGH